jgi:hypothetical protein
MIEYEIRKRGRDSLFAVYAPKSSLRRINKLASKHGASRVRVLKGRRDQIIGLEYSLRNASGSGRRASLSPRSFARLLQESANNRVAALKDIKDLANNLPDNIALTHSDIKLDFKVVKRGKDEVLNVYAPEEALELVDSFARERGVEPDDYLMGVDGGVVGRSYYETPDLVLPHLSQKQAPLEFMAFLKKTLTPQRLMKIPSVKKEVTEANEKLNEEMDRFKDSLKILSSYEELVEENEKADPNKIHPRDYTVFLIKVTRMVGAANRLSRDFEMLSRNARDFSFKMDLGLYKYKLVQKIPLINALLGLLRNKDYKTELRKLREVKESLDKKKNYITAMTDLTQVHSDLESFIKSKGGMRGTKRKRMSAKRGLDKRLSVLLREPNKYMGSVLSKVFLQRYDILNELYFSDLS